MHVWETRETAWHDQNAKRVECHDHNFGGVFFLVASWSLTWWVGLVWQLIWCCWCCFFIFFHFFVVEDEDEVLHVPDWWLFSCCCGFSLLMRMMTSWCRWFGLVIAFVAVLNSLFLCSQGWWRCGAGVCRRHYSTAYSGPANGRRYQMLWNALGTGNHQIWTSLSRFLERVIFKFLFLQNIQEAIKTKHKIFETLPELGITKFLPHLTYKVSLSTTIKSFKKCLCSKSR